MTESIDTIAFLANSKNRVRVLEEVAQSPANRAEIQEATGTNKVTLGRILSDLEDQRWIVRTGTEYAITPLGDQVLEEFTRLIDLLDIGHRLGDALAWVPSDVVSFDLRCLEDAEVTLRGPNDVTAIERRFIEAYRAADRIQVLSYQVTPGLIEVVWQLAVQEGGAIDAVVAPGLVDAALGDSEMAEKFREFLDAETVSLSISEDIPVHVAILDDHIVMIALSDKQDMLQAGVRSVDDSVREWADDLFEQYREIAEPVDSEAFPA